MLDLASVRQDYRRASLDEKDVLPDPLAQFEVWFAEAVKAEAPMPNAMSLSTVSHDHKPSSRIVLLKGVDHGGFVFYTNTHSRKGREISANPHASLLFSWLELERQVRIDGTLSQVSDAEADTYFASRPLGSRHAAIASPQSEGVASRAVLEQRFADAERSTGDTPARPPHWSGYRLTPVEIEFWQGRPNRLHDRVLYRQSAQGWTVQRLAP
jgi:pyridoxamine 5'-phosphate oxidase